MARPMVQVIQEIAVPSVAVTNPELNTVIVGECYNVRKYLDDKLVIAYNVDYGVTDTAVMECDPAENNVGPALQGAITITASQRDLELEGAPGADLDEGSVNVYLDDVYVIVDGANNGANTGNKGAVATGMLYRVSLGGASSLASSNSLTTNGFLVQPGDRLVIENQLGATAVRTVQGVDTSGEYIYVAENLPASFDGTTALAWWVEHKLDDQLGASSASTNEITIAGGVAQTLSYLGGNRVVSNGKIYVEYRELRKDLSADLSTFSSSTLALAELGVATSENPLGLAASLYFANSTRPLRVLAVDSDNSVGHNAAIGVLAARSDVYCIVVLSETSSILGSYSTHATVMSAPARSKFRIAIGGGDLITSLTLETGVSLIGNGSTGEIQDTTAGIDYVGNGVAVGDILTVTGGASSVLAPGTYEITGILSSTTLVTATTGGNATDGTLTYTITRALDKQAQVDNLETVPESFDSQRMFLVWPDSVVVGTETVGGYYLGAALGGMISSLPSHQGFTNVGVAGVGQLNNSNFYFTTDQVDELSNSGWYVFIQESLASLPFCVHQVSTAQSGVIEETELNVIKNFDFLSIFFQDILDGFIGNWNINSNTLGIIEAAVQAGISAQTSVPYPRLGSKLISGSINSISVDSSTSTQVNLFVDLILPKPLNVIQLHLVSN